MLPVESYALSETCKSNLILTMDLDPENIAPVPECDPEVAVNRRRPYQRISLVDRQRIVDAYEQNRDWLSVAEALQIKRQSARNIIVKFRNTGRERTDPKGGAKNKKVDNKMLQRLIQFIEHKATITLNELKKKL